jgi:hypothetical protein
VAAVDIPSRGITARGRAPLYFHVAP